VPGRAFNEAFPCIFTVFADRSSMPDRAAGGVIFEPDDHHLRAIRELVLHPVELPAAIAVSEREPSPCRLRSLLRRGAHLATADQHPVDRRDSGRSDAFAQHPLADRPGAVVPTLLGEFLANTHYLLLDR
jgi:hypothetical protein